ncbi:hypothetical protein LG307_03295 [Sutcliffiella horikoshii]|uniref:hypothetical protein n=1 Tax=Sutcliffiella horikoshii TaxID=79883 RepID=UPI00384BFC84
MDILNIVDSHVISRGLENSKKKITKEKKTPKGNQKSSVKNNGPRSKKEKIKSALLETENISGNSYSNIEPKYNMTSLSIEEIKVLRTMMSEWIENKVEEDRTEVQEISIQINAQLFKILNAYARQNNLSKTVIIERALENFLVSKEFLIDNESEKRTTREGQKSTVAKKGQNNNPNNWDTEKEKLLIDAIIEGTKEGRTIRDITQEVSSQINISASACQSYWNSKVSKQFKDQFKEIKLDQEFNWSEKDLELLEQIVFFEYAHLTPYEVLPIASKRLKRHIDVVRKKLFELQRKRRTGGE